MLDICMSLRICVCSQSFQYLSSHRVFFANLRQVKGVQTYLFDRPCTWLVVEKYRSHALYLNGSKSPF